MREIDKSLALSDGLASRNELNTSSSNTPDSFCWVGHCSIRYKLDLHYRTDPADNKWCYQFGSSCNSCMKLNSRVTSVCINCCYNSNQYMYMLSSPLVGIGLLNVQTKFRHTAVILRHLQVWKSCDHQAHYAKRWTIQYTSSSRFGCTP